MKCAIYCRYSSKAQDSGYSIEAQREACLNYATKENWEIHKIYIDKALSGTSDDRASFQEMISDATGGKESPFHIILVHKLDRFARNRYDSVRYKHVLKKAGVRVISVSQPIVGSGDPTEILLESLLEGMDEFYSANLARETIKGMVQNAKEGYWNGGNPPFGYRLKKVELNGKSRSILEVEPSESVIVEKMFWMFSTGLYGSKAITSELNESGFRQRNGRLFTKKMVRGILENEKYVGDTVFGKQTNVSKAFYETGLKTQIVKDTHQAIIKRDTFDKVQKLIEKRAEDDSPPIGRNGSFLLSGLIVCKKCGGRFLGASAKSGKHFYYRCRTGNMKGRLGCDAPLLNRDKIEEKIVQVLKEKIITKENIMNATMELFQFLKEQERRYKDQLQHFQRNIQDKEKRLGKLYKAIEEREELDYSDLAPRIRELKNEIEILKPQESELISKCDEHRKIAELDKAEFINRYTNMLIDLFSDHTLYHNKTLINNMIAKIEVGNGEVTLFWKLISPEMIPEEKFALKGKWQPLGESNPCLMAENHPS